MNYLAPHRSECAALPKGWIREEYPRASGGISSKKSDVYYVSPQGKRVRSKPELLKVLGNDRYDLTAFDFQTGKINTHLLRNAYAAAAAAAAHQATGGAGQHSSRGYADSASRQSGKTVNGRGGHSTVSGSGSGSGGVTLSSEARGGNHDFARQDATLVPPIRQTASIFKQPVTVHKTSGKSPSREGGSDEKTNGIKGGGTTPSSRSILGLDKPRQIFWEKRLSGLQPSYEDAQQQQQQQEDEEDDESMDDGEAARRRHQQRPAFKLPAHFKPVGPGVDTDILLASISTSIHLGSSTIRGQTAAKMNVEDISAFILPDQPLIQAASVTQEDVDRQEAKVTATRAKLAKALEALSG